MRDMADDYALEGVSMTVRGGNLFADLSAASAGEEAFSEIFAQPGLKIERIIIAGASWPAGVLV